MTVNVATHLTEDLTSEEAAHHNDHTDNIHSFFHSMKLKCVTSNIPTVIVILISTMPISEQQTHFQG